MNRRTFTLTALAVLALLPAMLLRDFTPNNELRYLSIADEAARNGTLFTFTNHGMPYADKPPLYFWIIMAGKLLLGRHCMWFLSLFSLVPALVTIRTMQRWTRGTADGGHDGAIMLLTCGLFLGMAVFLRMDMLMCMFITLALHTFYKMAEGKGRRRVNTIMFPVYVFLAVFTKGPLGLLVPLVSSVVFLLATGRGRTVGRYWGAATWGVLALLSAAWFTAVYAEGGGGYLHNLLFHQTVDRAVNSFHHEAPFYYYLVAIWYVMAPWSLFLAAVITVGIRRHAILTDAQKLFAATAGSTIVMLSLISSKIQVYLLPAFPFITYLATTLMPTYKWTRLSALTLALPAAAFALAGPAWALFASTGHGIAGGAWPGIAALALSTGGCIAIYALYSRRSFSPAIRAMGGAMLCAVFMASMAIPDLNADIGFGKLCEAARTTAADCGTDRYYTLNIGRSENMDVYLGTDVKAVTSNELAQGDLPHGVLMLKERDINLLPPLPAKAVKRKVGRYWVVII